MRNERADRVAPTRLHVVLEPAAVLAVARIAAATGDSTPAIVSRALLAYDALVVAADEGGGRFALPLGRRDATVIVAVPQPGAFPRWRGLLLPLLCAVLVLGSIAALAWLVSAFWP